MTMGQTSLLALLGLAALIAAHGSHALSVGAPDLSGRSSSGGEPAPAGCGVQAARTGCEAAGCMWCSVAGHGDEDAGSCVGSADEDVPARALECPERAGAAVANPSDPCEGLDQKACDGSDECVWCKAAAVPSSCFTLAQAKFLPPAVFKCSKPSPSRAAPRPS